MIYSRLLWLFLFFFTSCGYKWGHDGSLPEHSKVYIPFVKGDVYGELTAALIQEISQSGVFVYSTYEADYDLEVEIYGIQESNIGFRYEIDKDQIRTNLLIPCEGRLLIEVFVKVICNETGELVCEPLKFFETLDFDHDYYFSHRSTTTESLGQLTEVEEAHDIALRPLYRRLAKRVIDYLTAVD